MNFFPKSDEEKDLIKFIAKFQYLNINDSKYFFSSKLYYRNRINNLISKKFLRKVMTNLVLDQLGIEYVKLLEFEYNVRNRNARYLPRLLYLSDLGVFCYSCKKTLDFTPSFCMKDKTMLTVTARRFIGILEINGFVYLTYHISEEHNKQYLNSVIYDIQKEKKYKNVIVLFDDIVKANMNDFTFGLNHVLMIEDNKMNRAKLQYLHSINWARIIEDYYDNKVFFAKYNFCDYTDYKDKYVSTFYFLDTEKIHKIKYFLRENKNKTADIICGPELEDDLRKELPNAHFCLVDFEKYIDKERKYYE